MNASFTIRAADYADLPTVVELAVEYVVKSRSPLRPEVTDGVVRAFRRNNFEHLSMILDVPEGGLFLAEDGEGQHIGHILLLANQTDTVSGIRQAWVYDVTVREQWWGKGVGRALMARGEQFAREFGHTYIGLGVTSANERAVEFYRELGYEIERIQMLKRLDK